jgi:DNA-binding NtrC family response regulator
MADVLVVDDEPVVCEVLSRWLSAAGHAVRAAHDADAALDAMSNRAADVVFCDVHMPGPNGLWLTGELRRRFPATAIVLATGDSTLPPNVSMQHGVLAYLLKPFRRSAVLAATEQAAAWHADAVTRGAPAADDVDHVAAWLASIDSGLKRDDEDD